MTKNPLSELKRQLRNTPIPLARTRLIIYSTTFTFSLISGFCYIVALIHQSRKRYRNYNGDNTADFENLMAVTLFPISWSMIWSFIVVRTLLIAIKHNASVTTIPDLDPSADEHGPVERHSTPPLPSCDLPKRASRHQTRRCCCCTCTPWFPKESGPHPIFVLCIEIFLWPSLAVFVSIFGIVFTVLYRFPFPLNPTRSTYRSGNCPSYTDNSRTQLRYHCAGDYKALVALTGAAAITATASCIIHLVAFVIACVLVHRWRGQMGLRRAQKAKRMDRTSAVGEGDVEAIAVWVEMGNRNGTKEAGKT